MEKQYISSVKMPNGSVYHVKDTEMREALNDGFLNEVILDGGAAPTNDDLIGVILDGGTAPID